MSMDTELERERMALRAERDALAAKLKEVDGRIDDLLATCHRLALELECLLLDTKDSAPVSRWWDSAMAALDGWHKAKDAASARPVPAEPVNARLLEALKRLSFCAQTTGGVAGRDDELCSAIEASAKAIAEAEAKQAGPARLTDEVIERLWYSSRGISTLFARAIETSILERNGFNPQAKRGSARSGRPS